MIRPSPQYNVQNESLFRAEVDRQDGENVKTNKGQASFILFNDDGAPYRITLVAGVLTATAIP